MRISDWSSDVCSSDLDGSVRARQDTAHRLQPARDRRSRPDARHGLHPGHREYLHQTAGDSADPAVFGDDAAADQETRRQIPVEPEDDRSGASGEPEREYRAVPRQRSEEHTSDLQSLMRISYAVFCLKKKK